MSVSVPVLSEQMRATEPERLNRRQTPHDRVAGRHPLDADRKRDGDEGRQSFGDHRHRDAGHRLEHFDERNVAHEMPEGERDRANDQNDDRDRIAELLDLKQERGLERADAGEQLIDAAEFSLASRRDDNSARAAGDDQRAGIGHAGAIADGRLVRDGRDRFVRRHGFAGERRFFRAQVLDVGEADVGGDLVAGFEEHDVARHERLRRDHRRLSVAQGSRFRREHVADRIERLLRPAFLKEAEQSVDDDHAEDDRGVQPQVHHQLDEAGGEQHIDKHIVELLQETHERTALARRRQHVEAVFRLAARGFGIVEPRRHAALEPLDRLVSGQRVPGRLFCFAHCSSSMRAAAARSRCATARQA